MAKYAEGTSVTPEKSRSEIESTLRRYGADQFVSGWDQHRALIGFTAHGRQIRFVLPVPTLDDYDGELDRYGREIDAATKRKRMEDEERRRWRALALAVKAKLEVVETGIATFEEEFMAHIVMPDGRTVGEHAAGAIEQAYSTGRMDKPLLALGAGK